jgi:hypothetical protein
LRIKEILEKLAKVTPEKRREVRDWLDAEELPETDELIVALELALFPPDWARMYENEARRTDNRSTKNSPTLDRESCRARLPGFSSSDTPHGSGSWRVYIPLFASADANLRPPQVCVGESNQVPAAPRGRSIRDWPGTLERRFSPFLLA